ncbi:MAG: hypothetical protein J2P15_03270 [Micromonosporaceae bacterium]|nr:hypothetical protein [Micromonosporaceae bacterium]
MCTYATTVLPVSGSGKGPDGWFTLRRAAVYLDHPVHAPAEHTLNIDLANPELGAAARVAVELDPAAARALAEAILAALDSAPPGLVEAPGPVEQPARAA